LFGKSDQMLLGW